MRHMLSDLNPISGYMLIFLFTLRITSLSFAYLSNSYNSWQHRLHGDILLNGVSVSPSRLQDRVAYVRRNNAFGADMSVRQTMLFHSFLREPGTHARSRDAKGRVSEMP